MRNSFQEVTKIVKQYKNLTGIFHSFSGTQKEAEEILSLGNFKLGINGIVTFKNSSLSEVLNHIDIHHLVLETDAPYLAPTPHRGKRNEPAYLVFILKKLTEIYQKETEEIKKICTNNSLEIFKKLKKHKTQ